MCPALWKCAALWKCVSLTRWHCRTVWQRFAGAFTRGKIKGGFMCDGTAFCLNHKRVWVKCEQVKHFICRGGDMSGSREWVSVIPHWNFSVFSKRFSNFVIWQFWKRTRWSRRGCLAPREKGAENPDNNLHFGCWKYHSMGSYKPLLNAL